MAENAQETVGKVAKTASITLRGGSQVMVLVAVRRADGSATTSVTVVDGKKRSRGMTRPHASFDAAVAALASLATDAAKAGWSRSARRGFVAKPDVFSVLPAPPKAGGKK